MARATLESANFNERAKASMEDGRGPLEGIGSDEEIKRETASGTLIQRQTRTTREEWFCHVNAKLGARRLLVSNGTKVCC